MGNWTRRSTDGGKTWEKPVRTSSTAPHGPIQLRDGRLLYIGNGTWNGLPALVAEQSMDDGQSWQVIATFKTESGSITGISEPHLVETRSGKIIAMFRNEPNNNEKFLLQSESHDGGVKHGLCCIKPRFGGLSSSPVGVEKRLATCCIWLQKRTLRRESMYQPG